jgi:predicted RNA-binding Zn-ribbon protein involved in translation (DUF1610 family)
VALIVALPEGWFVRVTRRLRTNPAPVGPNRTPSADAFRLVCSECGEVSSRSAGGWKAYLTFEGEPLFVCPACAERDLHRSNDRRHRRPTE